MMKGGRLKKMENKTIARQIIDFNKATFDNTFDAVTILQSHSEKMVNIFLEKATFFPEEGKKAITEWIESYKKGRNDYKAVVEEGFKSVENWFAHSATEWMKNETVANEEAVEIKQPAAHQKATRKAARTNKK